MSAGRVLSGIAVACCVVSCAMPPADGTAPVAANADGTVSTIAGTGIAGFDGDGGRSSGAQLNQPMDVTLDGDGRLLIADFNNHRVRRLDLGTGIITTIAGNGAAAGADSIALPSGVTCFRQNTFLVAAWGEHRILEYGYDGRRVRAVGNGLDSCSKVDGTSDPMATSMVAPRSVAVLADRSLLVSEQGCHRVLRIREDRVSRYAGNGAPDHAGDQGPATLAAIHAGALSDGPSLGISLSPEDPPDELFIADTANHIIRQVHAFTGQIETFAGSGEPGFADGPPEQARFNRPTHVTSAPDHSLWIVDTGNHAIRYVDPLRIRVTTVAGTGEAGFNGDGRAPTETQLDSPTSVWVTRAGLVFIADAGNQRIRLYDSR